MGQEAIGSFFRFINERHRIYLRRQAGEEWPWSKKDPILQKFKFTNVFRELDRTTIWLRANWREPYADHPDLWFAIAVARTINWPPTLEEIGFPDPWDPRRVAGVIEARKARGEKVFSDAYQGAASRKKGQPRGDYVAHKILDPLSRRQPPLHKAKTLERAWRMLQGLPGLGGDGFVAYEVVTDLRHTPCLRNAPDVMTWAHAGPGAKMGLDQIWGREILIDKRGKRSSNLPEHQAQEEMRYLLEASPNYLEDHVPDLEMRDVEHCCCEMDKYLRAKAGDTKGLRQYQRPKFYDLGLSK